MACLSINIIFSIKISWYKASIISSKLFIVQPWLHLKHPFSICITLIWWMWLSFVNVIFVHLIILIFWISFRTIVVREYTCAQSANYLLHPLFMASFENIHVDRHVIFIESDFILHVRIKTSNPCCKMNNMNLSSLLPLRLNVPLKFTRLSQINLLWGHIFELHSLYPLCKCHL